MAIFDSAQIFDLCKKAFPPAAFRAIGGQALRSEWVHKAEASEVWLELRMGRNNEFGRTICPPHHRTEPTFYQKIYGGIEGAVESVTTLDSSSKLFMLCRGAEFIEALAAADALDVDFTTMTAILKQAYPSGSLAAIVESASPFHKAVTGGIIAGLTEKTLLSAQKSMSQAYGQRIDSLFMNTGQAKELRDFYEGEKK